MGGTASQRVKLNGIYSELEELIGIDGVIKIYSSFRGQQVSFPMRFYSREYVIEEIKANYDGRNVKELAQRFGFSERWVREIIRRE